MSNGANIGSTVNTNQEFLREIALNSYGYGSNSGEEGGRGNIGLVLDGSGHSHVVKFNTSWFTHAPKAGSPAYDNSLEASNRLRKLLANIAQTSDLPEDTLREIRNKLGVDNENKPLPGVPLLTRKVTAAVAKMIDKDIWTRVKAEGKRNQYSTKGQGWDASEKAFASMQNRIGNDGTFKGAAVALDKTAAGKGRLESRLANVVENAVENAQSKRDSALSFGAIRTFEGALQDAADKLKEGNALTDAQIRNALAQKSGDFLKLAAQANGQPGAGADVAAAFAGIRKAEAEDPHKAGLMRKTLAALLVSSVTSDTNLASVTALQIQTARAVAEGLLPAQGSDDYNNIGTINELARTVVDPTLAPREFSRAFTTPRQRADAVAILRKLQDAGWDNKVYFGTSLPLSLVHKAVIEARKFQPDNEALSDDSIYAALVGKLPADNGNKPLGEAVDERVLADFTAACGGRNPEMDSTLNKYLTSASTCGLKYDYMLEALRHPGLLPTVHDIFDTSIRPLRRDNRGAADTPGMRYKEFAARRVASRYLFRPRSEFRATCCLDSQDYYFPNGLNDAKKEDDLEDAGTREIAGLMERFENDDVRQMVTDMLMQDIGDPFFIGMFGPDIRYREGEKSTHKYRRDFRNFSDFTFHEMGVDGNRQYRLVVTPNREALRNSDLANKNIDYEIEFLIDHKGNAWVTKQWLKG